MKAVLLLVLFLPKHSTSHQSTRELREASKISLIPEFGKSLVMSRSVALCVFQLFLPSPPKSTPHICVFLSIGLAAVWPLRHPFPSESGVASTRPSISRQNQPEARHRSPVPLACNRRQTAAGGGAEAAPVALQTVKHGAAIFRELSGPVGRSPGTRRGSYSRMSSASIPPSPASLILNTSENLDDARRVQNRRYCG